MPARSLPRRTAAPARAAAGALLLAAIATEAGLSRIYAGVHTRPDHAVARYVLGHALRPLPVARG
jgi:hypothetical protein